MQIYQGDIFFGDLSPGVGNEQMGVRPVLIISNDIINRYSPTLICVSITAQISEPKLPTHVALESTTYGFDRDAVILTEHVRTIDKNRLTDRITRLDACKMIEVLDAFKLTTSLEENFTNQVDNTPVFIHNTEFNKEEDIEIELKEIKGRNPIDSIKQKVGEYATSFLNSKGGHIYWGITDSRIIKGVHLNEAQRDELRRVVYDKLNTIQPSISASAFELEFHNILTNEEIMKDNFIVEVRIPAPIDPSTVYFLGGKEIYVRVNGSTRVLIGSAIQDFILRKRPR